MKIIFNGTAAEIADGTTLNAFLEERKIQRKNVIVELNEDVVMSTCNTFERDHAYGQQNKNCTDRY